MENQHFNAKEKAGLREREELEQRKKREVGKAEQRNFQESAGEGIGKEGFLKVKQEELAEERAGKANQGLPQGEGENEENGQLTEAGKLKSYIEKMTKMAEPTFWGYLGCKIESASAEKVVVTLDAKSHHMNMMGIVHGGVLSSLMDNAMGIAVMLLRPGESTVTSNLNVHFVMPAREGRLFVTAHIVHQTHRSVTTESRITNERGELVALSTGSFRVK